MSKLPPLGAVRGCSKVKCCLAAPINRHHKRHEALWLHVWAHRAANGEPQFREFIKRYYEYREDDVVRICMWHHAEIHMMYDLIIADDMAKTGLPLYLYSWKQAKILMQKLEDTCAAWLLMNTPGIDPQVYEDNKQMWRGLSTKSAKRKRPRPEPLRGGVGRKKLKKAKQRRKRRRR